MMAGAFYSGAFEPSAFYIDTGAGSVLEADLVSQSSTTSVLSTSIQLACTLSTVSSITCSLSTSIQLNSSVGGTSTITAELTDSTSGMSANLSSMSACTFTLTTGVRFSADLVSTSTVTAQLDGSVPEEPATYQNKKLILLQDAGDAYPLNTINDAMDTYLEQRYTVSGGLSDLIARYLGE